MQVPEFRFTAVDGPVAVSHDGEVEESFSQADFRVDYRVLKVFRPVGRERP